MIKEFREFIARGNVMDMAVGIIIGAAFTAIVNSMVKDLINPIIAVFTNGIDFTNMFVVLGSGKYDSLGAARDAGAAVFAYGSFVNSVINFLIVAFVVFILVKAVNRIKQAHEVRAEAEATPQAPAGPTEKEVLIEIRDALIKR